MATIGIPLDTTLEAFEVWIQALRRLGPVGRLRQASALSRSIAKLCETGIRRRHPDYGDHQVFLARVRLELGDDLYARAYPGEAQLAP